jgi:hypothetical protein
MLYSNHSASDIFPVDNADTFFSRGGHATGVWDKLRVVAVGDWLSKRALMMCVAVDTQVAT